MSHNKIIVCRLMLERVQNSFLTISGTENEGGLLQPRPGCLSLLDLLGLGCMSAKFCGPVGLVLPHFCVFTRTEEDELPTPESWVNQERKGRLTTLLISSNIQRPELELIIPGSLNRASVL